MGGCKVNWGPNQACSREPQHYGPCAVRPNGAPPPKAALSQVEEDLLQIFRQQQTLLEMLIGDLRHYGGHLEKVPMSRINQMAGMLPPARDLLNKYPRD